MERAAEIDLDRLQRGRLGRLREQLTARDLAACVLVDPVNIRYATGAQHASAPRPQSRPYLFLPAEGPVILFEFPSCHHLARGLATIDEIRPATTVSFVAAGPCVEDQAKRWAAEIADLLCAHGGDNRRVAIERVNYAATAALAAQGFVLSDAQDPVEGARAIKLPEEIACIRASLAAAEQAVASMLEALRPGISENQLWALLHKSVIEQGGDYVETRLLSSGPRTNPWFQEAGPRKIGAGDLVALDTDVVGASATTLISPGRSSAAAADPAASSASSTASPLEQVQANLALIRPGMTFRELSENAWPIPEAYALNRYFVSSMASA